MCFVADEYPEAHRTVDRRARKPHRCSECGGEIPKGATYRYDSGVFEGAPYSYKRCLRCIALVERVVAHEIAEGCAPGESYPPAGLLWESALECGVITHDEYDRKELAGAPDATA
jgi:uncharacterized protein with PIN domain